MLEEKEMQNALIRSNLIKKSKLKNVNAREKIGNVILDFIEMKIKRLVNLVMKNTDVKEIVLKLRKTVKKLFLSLKVIEKFLGISVKVVLICLQNK